MGFFEKRKFRNFLIFLQSYNKSDPSTWRNGKNLDQMTMRQLFDDFGLDTYTQTFTGHAMALQTDDDYLNMKASYACECIQLYVYSLERYGKSPYIYPIYGLGGLPEGFSRLCAIHGGTFMLNKVFLYLDFLTCLRVSTKSSSMNKERLGELKLATRFLSTC